jgi:hypothetical protein
LLQPNIDSAHLVNKTCLLTIWSLSPSALPLQRTLVQNLYIAPLHATQTIRRCQLSNLPFKNSLCHQWLPSFEKKPGIQQEKTILPRFTPTSPKASTKLLPLTIVNLSPTKYPKEDLCIGIRTGRPTFPDMSGPLELATEAPTSPEDPIPIDLLNGIKAKRVSFLPDIQSPELTGNRPNLVLQNQMLST